MPIIEVNHVAKEYQLGQLQSLKTAAFNQWQRLRGLPIEERAPFKALDDINFSIEAGEVVGIIGHNGAGKSTILKLLASISKPTCGDIIVKGKIAPLIEVGAGLVGDLTGRENVYLNGTILGISKAEIKRKFDDIVAFAELEEFIDTPIKRYSSGMQVRLGFSIATSVNADILIVDEVLAVGDLAFQRKCFNRMNQIINEEGRTVIVVGHNVRQLEQICTRMLLIERGKLIMDGISQDVCNRYFQMSNKKISSDSLSMTNTAHEMSQELLHVELSVLNEVGAKCEQIEYKKACEIVVDFELASPFDNVIFHIGTHTVDFIHVSANETFASPVNLDAGRHSLRLKIRSMELLPGTYSFRLWMGSKDGQPLINGYNMGTLRVFSKEFNISRMEDTGFFQLLGDWSTPGRLA
jgi:lipopolysaccharide transport system ATP-binding protein